LDYADVRPGERIEGVYRRSIELASGRFAVIEKSREFTLVPWRPVLERSLGRQVSGIAREETISWMLGRQRSGPSISWGRRWSGIKQVRSPSPGIRARERP
jgi:Protein of unknown function (DUF3363)